MSQATLGPAWDDYVDSLCEDAHQLLYWGYLDARPNLHLAQNEYDITGMICQKMNDRIESDPTERYWCYYVADQQPISPAGELGLARRRLDIHVVENGLAQRKPRFTFEAKRMRDVPQATEKQSIDGYVGPEGLGRFINETYAAESGQAGMLGLVEAHNCRHWHCLVAEFLADQAIADKWSLSIMESFRSISLVPELSEQGLTVHKRASGRPIRIFHSFLDCTSASAVP